MTFLWAHIFGVKIVPTAPVTSTVPGPATEWGRPAPTEPPNRASAGPAIGDVGAGHGAGGYFSGSDPAHRQLRLGDLRHRRSKAVRQCQRHRS